MWRVPSTLVSALGASSSSRDHLIALVGKHGEGKSTLLKILAGLLIPSRGTFFFPPHLRAFYVTQEPLFIQASLFENLTYGLHEGDPDASLERVTSICRRVGIEARLLKFIMTKDVEFDLWKTLSLTERVQLHVARGLIANPEILIMEKPTLTFDQSHALLVLKTLRKYVDRKGLDLDAYGRSAITCRPRTCIFTATRLEGCAIADQVWQVTTQCVSPLTQSQIEDGMLV